MFISDKIILSKEDIKGIRLPLLHKEEEWINLFGNSKNKSIKEHIEKIIELELEERKLKKSLKDLNIDKQRYLKSILVTSDSVNRSKNKKDIKLLDEYRARLLKVNDEIDEIEYRLEILPDEIRDLNFDILNLTIAEGYGELKEREKKLEDVNSKIQKIEEVLSKLREVKLTNEQWINENYSFMHRILGSDLIETIDQKYEEK